MVEIKITVKSVQTTDEGTLVIEMSPYPYARWIQTEALANANVAVQPYGVIMVPEAATFTPGGLTVDVEVKGYIFSVPLATLMEASAEDQIEFISPYITVADLADVDLTNLQNGQTLIWDATNNVWVNGAGGGGGSPGYRTEKVYYAEEQTVTLSYNEELGGYAGYIITIMDIPEWGKAILELNGNKFEIDLQELYNEGHIMLNEGLILAFEDPDLLLFSTTAINDVTVEFYGTKIIVDSTFKSAVRTAADVYYNRYPNTTLIPRQIVTPEDTGGGYITASIPAKEIPTQDSLCVLTVNGTEYSFEYDSNRRDFVSPNGISYPYSVAMDNEDNIVIYFEAEFEGVEVEVEMIEDYTELSPYFYKVFQNTFPELFS